MYADRREAGQKLAQAMERFRDRDVVVLALPRGGVVLGAEVAKALYAPLDVVLVRKIGHPFSPEYAIGAVVLGEQPMYNESETADEGWLKRTAAEQQKVNERRRKLYYGHEFEPIPLKGKTVVIVDDGIATGLTMEAAVRAALRQHPKRVIVAVPVAPADSVETLKELAEVVVLDNPDDFLGAVGAHYREFAQVDDDEVRLLLQEQRHKQHPAGNDSA